MKYKLDIDPVAKKKVYQSIVEQFVNMLKEDRIKIGQKLPPERDLAEKFKVSRPSLREALRALEMIGLVEIRQGGGVFVTEVNIAPFINAISPLFMKIKNYELELLELRRILELRAVELASQNITDQKVKLLQKSIENMRTAMKRDDFELGAMADIEFHETIFSITDNYVLSKAAECVVTILEMSVKYARLLILQDADNSLKLFQQHMKIFGAIRDRKPRVARAAMEKHLDFVVDFYTTKKNKQ